MTETYDKAIAALLEATGRADLEQSVSWLAEGRDIRSAGPSWHDVFTALAVLPTSPKTTDALRRVLERSAVSHLDSSADLLALDRVITPEQHHAALEMLKLHAVGNSLAALTAAAVHAAQADNEHVISCLCDIAGLSYRDLADRLKASGAAPPPGEPDGTWTTGQVKAAWKILDAHVVGQLSTAVAGATPARALEHLLGVPGRQVAGWALVEDLHTNGVPYSVLLAQRGAGGAWLAHRNRTNNLLVGIVTTEIESVLQAQSVETLAQRDLGRKEWQALLGPASGPIQLCAIRRADDHEPEAFLGITVVSARDGGTVRKSVGQLEPVPALFPKLPLAAVVVGPGWADRVLSTAELGRAYEGRLYTELQLSALAQLAAQLK